MVDKAVLIRSAIDSRWARLLIVCICGAIGHPMGGESRYFYTTENSEMEGSVPSKDKQKYNWPWTI